MSAERTEPPTPRRLERARREGNVPVSSALLQAVGLLVALLLVPSALAATADRFLALLRIALRGDLAAQGALPAAHVALMAVELAAPVLLAVALAVAITGGVQTRGLFVPARVAPDLSRMSPLTLVRGLFSPQRAFAIVRALLTTALVVALVARRFDQHMGDLARSAGRIREASFVAGELAWLITRDVALLVLALAVIDLVVTRRAWLSRLKMSRSEVRKEHRETEGDPQLKAARERAYQEMVAAAAVHAVRDATVVIVNPRHLAAALRYLEDEDEAPQLVAKGEGELARRIVEAAHAYGIPVVRDVPLARALLELSEGEMIPTELYEAVALVLRDVYEQQGEREE